MFKLHDNPQVAGGRKRQGWNGETKTKAILRINQLPHQTPQRTEGTCLSIWHHMRLTKTKDLLGRNIQVFRRRPILLWSLHFVSAYIHLLHIQGNCANAGILIETKEQLHCQTYWQINTLLHRNKLCSFLRKWSHWKVSFSQSSYSSLISYLH